MRETIRNGKSQIISYRETGSGNREVLRDKAGRILGRFETDTTVTRDSSGKIIGRASNQLFRLL
jgi:YD repeat-containing protein